MAEQNSKNKKGKTGTRAKQSTKTAGKKTAGGKSTARTGRKTRETKRSIAKQKSFLHAEIGGIAAIFAGLLLLLVNFGLLGSFGAWLLGIERGLFGQAYFLPAVLVIGGAFLVYAEQGKYMLPYKVAGLALSLPVLSALLHLMFGGELIRQKGGDPIAVSTLYEQCSGGASGGGVVGGVIANGLHSFIGYAGAYLVLIALLIICVVVLTEKSFVSIARNSAEKTAHVVRAGADRTVEAARSGREKYARYHQENQIRREARREEEKLRRLEESFEDLGPGKSEPSLAGLTLSGRGFAGVNMAEAERYASYGRDIIGEEQPGLETVQNAREPLFRTTPKVRTADQSVNYDTQVIRDVFTEEPRTARMAVNVKEINYEVDDVPFEEPEDETYQSYASLLDAGRMNIEAARKAGFAVGRNEVFHMPGETAGEYAEEPEAAGEPQSFAAFRDKDDYVNDGFVTNPQFSGFGDDADQTDNIREPVQNAEPASAGEYNKTAWSATDTEHPAETDRTYTPGAEWEETEEFPGKSEEDTRETYEDGWNKEDIEPEDEVEVYVDGYGKTREVDRYEAEEILRKKAPESVRAAMPETQNKTAPEETQPKPKPKPKPKPRPYVFPPEKLLEKSGKTALGNRQAAEANARKLEQVLKDFGIGVTVTNVIRGPRVSRYVMTPDTGVKVSRITSLEGDIKLALAARELRILAPIPGESAVGIEVPNEESQTVRFRDILESEEFKNAKSKLSWGIGLDIQGRPVVGDIAKMPHLLVAGTTGSGKSVGINSLIMSILYRATPEEVRMILIDPKVVELSVYNGIPHLLTEVVTKPERAVSALNWAVQEMNNRYKLFQASGTRNIKGYNEKVAETNASLPEDSEERLTKLPYILIIIDELAELMMHSKKDIEAAIVSLTQLARAAGLHLVVATQRPSVDVITGLIKSNIPSRIAYRLPSPVDSRTILDSGGAETLLGNGDMLYKPGDKNNPDRIQGAFLSDNEVEAVVKFVRQHNPKDQDTAVEEAISQQISLDLNSSVESEDSRSDLDEYYAEAGRLIINTKKASIGALQRKFKIGFNRAARIMEQLHDAGVVSDSEGTKERQILMTLEQFEEMLQNS